MAVTTLDRAQGSGVCGRDARRPPRRALPDEEDSPECDPGHQHGGCGGKDHRTPAEPAQHRQSHPGAEREHGCGEQNGLHTRAVSRAAGPRTPVARIATHPRKPTRNSGTIGSHFVLAATSLRRRATTATPAATGASSATRASLTVTATASTPPAAPAAVPSAAPAATTCATLVHRSPQRGRPNGVLTQPRGAARGGRPPRASTEQQEYVDDTRAVRREYATKAVDRDRRQLVISAASAPWSIVASCPDDMENLLRRGHATIHQPREPPCTAPQSPPHRQHTAPHRFESPHAGW